jgi:Ca2+-binding RTX toxin-like protein
LRPSAVSLQTALSADGQSLSLAEAGTFFSDALQIWEVERFYLGGGDDSFFVSDASLGPGNGPLISFLNGGLGNDRLGGGTNGAVIDGDEGVDSYRLGNGFTRVDLQAGTATGEGRTLTLRRIEKVYGDDVNDTLLGARRADFLAGGNGIDTIDGREGNDTLHGGEGDDTLSGGLGDDTINGDAIDDADAPVTAAGTDTVSYAAAAAAVTVNLSTGVATGEGRDTLLNIEHVVGSGFGDVLKGNAAKNELIGGDGDDRFITTTGGDKLVGGKGVDTVDFTTEAAGVQCDLGTGEASGIGLNTLSGIESAIGSRFADNIKGSSSNNAIEGGAGDDLLNGHAGTDRLTGGAGSDTFVYDRRDAQDVIVDFRPGEDVIAIDNAIFSALTSLLPEGSLASARFVAGTNPAASREAQFLYETDTGILRFDADGAGGLAPIALLRLVNKAALTFADIEII